MNSDGRPDLIGREASTGKLWLYPGKTGSTGSRVLIGTGGWNAIGRSAAGRVEQRQLVGPRQRRLLTQGFVRYVHSNPPTSDGKIRSSCWTANVRGSRINFETL
jgi:hypothetical protein